MMIDKNMIVGGYRHFKTITAHKLKVQNGCFRIGLIKQGLLHDLSKYAPVEFLVGAKYYQGTRSPNNAEREDLGYSAAWLHHKGRNKHHYEYWTDYSTRGDVKGGVAPVKMPRNYVAEMVMDRIAASKIYIGEKYTDADPLKYLLSAKEAPIMHPETRKELEFLLRMLAERGEEYTFGYIRYVYLKKPHPPVRKSMKK